MRTRAGWKIALAAAALPLLAQDATVPSNTARLTLVPFHVVKDGHQVGGLTQDDIVLLEDGAPRKISYFAGPAQNSLDTLFNGQRASPAAPIELVVLLNSTGGSMLIELRYPPQYRQPPYGGVDGSASLAAWLKGAFLDRAENSRISVYGFDETVERYCRPTRDPKEIRAAIRAAEKGSRGTILVQRAKGQRPDWDEAIAATARDAATEPDDAIRVMLPMLGGLPPGGLQPHAIAGLCLDLGITVYPMFRDLAWPAYARRYESSSGGGHVVGGLLHPVGNELNLDKMSAEEVFVYLSMKEREFADYGKLGDETGGRSGDPHMNLESVFDDIEARVRSVYAAGVMPDGTGGAPRPHKLEIRLRDPKLGVVQGGTRAPVY
jgi:hypothetical protein